MTLFGELSARRSGCAIAKFRTRKAASLLAYLALQSKPRPPAGFSDGASLAGDRPGAGSQSASRGARLLAASAGDGGHACRKRHCLDRLTVRLNPDAVETDVALFERELARSQQAGSDEQRTEALMRAVEIATAPLLRDVDDAWVLPHAERLLDAQAGALRRLAGRSSIARTCQGRLPMPSEPCRRSASRTELPRPDPALSGFGKARRRARAVPGARAQPERCPWLWAAPGDPAPPGQINRRPWPRLRPQLRRRPIRIAPNLRRARISPSRHASRCH